MAHRHKDKAWDLPQAIARTEDKLLAVLMDIRDELKRIHRMIRRPNHTNKKKRSSHSQTQS